MSLIRPSDYIYTDVSQIEITGSHLPSRQDDVIRGEDIALVHEFAVESERVMGFNNPLANISIHAIVDLSYLTTRWWNVQKARGDIYPVNVNPQDYTTGGWHLISSEWNVQQKFNDLSALMLGHRIRNGTLQTPVSGDPITKSAISSIISASVVSNPYNNYFASPEGLDAGYAEFDLTSDTGVVTHKSETPYHGPSLPWSGWPKCCMYWAQYSNGELQSSRTASNLSVYPSRSPEAVGRSSPTWVSHDVIVAAVKSSGEYSPLDQKCRLFVHRYEALPYDKYIDLTSIDYTSLLSRVPNPSSSYSVREDCVFIACIGNRVERWRFNAYP